MSEELDLNIQEPMVLFFPSSSLPVPGSRARADGPPDYSLKD